MACVLVGWGTAVVVTGWAHVGGSWKPQASLISWDGEPPEKESGSVINGFTFNHAIGTPRL